MPVSTNVVDLLPLIKAVEDRLTAQLPTTSPPTKGFLSEPVDVPLLDAEGHVQRYWVLHPFAGTPTEEQDVAETAVDLVWTFQVTVAAGFARDCYALASLVNAALYRWYPAVTGYVCGCVEPPPGFDPGPARLDRDVKPYRHFLPMQYRTTVTRTS